MLYVLMRWHGVEWIRNKSQHRKLTLEAILLPPLLPGLEPRSFHQESAALPLSYYPRSPLMQSMLLNEVFYRSDSTFGGYISVIHIPWLLLRKATLQQQQHNISVPLIQQQQHNISVPLIQQQQHNISVSLIQQQQHNSSVPLTQQQQHNSSVPLIQQQQHSSSVPLIQQQQHKSSVPRIQEQQHSSSVPLIQQQQHNSSVPLMSLTCGQCRKEVVVS